MYHFSVTWFRSGYIFHLRLYSAERSVLERASWKLYGFQTTTFASSSSFFIPNPSLSVNAQLSVISLLQCSRELKVTSWTMLAIGHTVLALQLLLLRVISTESFANGPAPLNLVSEFTQYSLYFGNRDSQVDKCHASDVLNSTQLKFLKSIDRCPIKNYYLPILTTSQISWKSTPKKNDKSASEADRHSAKQNDSSSIEASKDDKSAKQRIHKYLAFALLLPKHPFSSDLLLSLMSTGPMFPSVTIVSANGYHFQDMCRQYNVKSFPQLFFFKDGLLIDTYKGVHSAPGVASKLANWTKTLPKALPIQVTDLGRQNYAWKNNEKQYFWPPKTELFAGEVLGFPVSMRVPYSTEPIMGTFEHLVPFESLIFMLAGFYIVCRIIYFTMKERVPAPIL